MKAFVKFNLGLLKMPLQWRMWLSLLITANMVAPLFFIGQPEAQLVLGALIASATLMTILTGLTGFTRLLGLGHIFWIPLVYLLWAQLDVIPADSIFGVWIRVVIALNTISLMIDAVDVIRYVGGDRDETVDWGEQAPIVLN